MKYLLITIISFLSINLASAEDVKGNILVLKKDTVYLIKGQDMIFAEKKDGMFYLTEMDGLTISKIVLPDSVEKAFKIKKTIVADSILVDSILKEYSKPLKILLGQYSIQWGEDLKWIVCVKSKTNEIVGTDGNKDASFGLSLIALGVLIGMALSIICSIIFIYRKSIKSRLKAWISTVKFKIRSKKIKADDGKTLRYIGNKKSFEVGDIAYPDGFYRLKKETSALLVEDGKIKLYFPKGSVRQFDKKNVWIKKSGDDYTVGDAAYPDDFYTLKKENLALLVKDKKIKLYFPKGSVRQSDKEKEVWIKKSSDDYTVGDIAYPDGFYRLKKENSALLVEDGKIKLYFPKGSVRQSEKEVWIKKSGDDYTVGDAAYPDGEYILSEKIIKIYDGKIKEITNKATHEQPIPNEPQSESSKLWYVLLPSEIKRTIEDLGFKVDDFQTWQGFISEIFTTLKQDDAISPKLEESIISNLINQMRQKSEKINTVTGAYNKAITNRDGLIDFMDYLLSQSYTLEELKKLAKRHYPEIEETLRLGVFDIYVKKRLGSKLGWNDNTNLDNAIKNLKIPTENDYETYVLNKINTLVVGKKFIKLDGFAEEWKKINERLCILQSLAERKNKTIDRFLNELKDENLTVNSEILIVGRTKEEAKTDLEAYDKLKSLFNFGKTGEEIESKIAENTENFLLGSIKTKYENVFKETLELDNLDGIIDKFVDIANRKESRAKEAGVQKVIAAVKNAVDNIKKDEKEEVFHNISILVQEIQKADSVEKMKSAIMQIRKVVDDLKNLNGKKKTAENEKQKAENAVLNAVKEKYETILNEKAANSKNPIDSITRFADKVQRRLSELGSLKEEMEGKIVQKDKKINQLFKVYSHIVIDTFEQTRENLDKVCENARKSEVLSDRFIKRVLQNDAFNVGDFMKEALDDILNNEQNIKDCNEDEIKKSLHNLFLSAVQGNSWLQTLSCIYLYVQHPKVADFFAKKGINVGCINVSFILTEHIMRLLDIKLSYPKLFEETFDSNLYDEATLSDVNDYVDNVKELVGDRHGVITDMHRLGYTADGETVKAQVVRFN